MTYPVIAATAVSHDTTNVTTHTVTMPSGIAAGHLLIAVCAVDNNSGTISNVTAGWTTAVDQGSASQKLVVFRKIAAGSDTLSFDTSATEQCESKVWRITGHNSSQAPEVAYTNYTTVTTSFDPPSVSPTGGSKDYLVIAAAAVNGNASVGEWSVSSYPSGYSNTGYRISQANTGSAGIAYADNTVTSATINPGAFAIQDLVGNFGGLGTGETGGVVTIVVHPSAAAAPTFDTSPTVTSVTSTSYTISYNADANANSIYVGAYLKDATAPTAAQLAAGTNAHGTASEATTGAADTIVLSPTESPTFPIYDVYAVLEGTGGFSSVVALVDEALTAPTGRQYVTVDVPWGGTEDSVLDGASPAAVDGDIIDCSTVTSPGGYSITMDADGVASFDPGADTGRQTFTARFYDVSVGDWSDASPVTFYVNNKVPTFDDITDSTILVQKDVAITAIPLAARWRDAESDAITVSFQDALPTGLSVAAQELVGTPTVYGNFTVTERATDVTGDYAEIETVIQVGDAVPDVIYLAEATARTTIEAVASFTTTVTYATSATVAIGDVISTDPPAGVLAAYDSVIAMVVSSGAALPGTGGAGFPVGWQGKRKKPTLKQQPNKHLNKLLDTVGKQVLSTKPKKPKTKVQPIKLWS